MTKSIAGVEQRAAGWARVRLVLAWLGWVTCTCQRSPPTHPPHAGAQCATAAHRIEIQAPAPCKPARPVWTKKFQKSTSTISHLPNNGLGEKILGQCALSSFCPCLLKCWLAKLKSTNYSGRHRFTKTRLLCDADQETALKNKTAQNAPLPISSRGSAIRVK